MKLRKLNRRVLTIVAGLMLLAAVPATNFAQGRNRGQEKKADRFVNRHDARDGRWDGRGPRTNRGSRINNEIRHRRHERFRNRDFDRDDRLRNRSYQRRRVLRNDNFLRSQRLRDRQRRIQRRDSNR